MNAPAASVLFAHATGFHGRVFDKTISFLPPMKYSCFTFDQRGHGRSPWPDDAPVTELSNWDGFGDDALEMSRLVRQQQHPDTNRCTGGVLGVGHSQGATALLLAALKEPEQFSALILYEPVVFPKLWRHLSHAFFHFSEAPLATSSRKRRREFDSLEDAFQNFASKPPMRHFHVDVLRDYIRHGLSASGEQLELELGTDAAAPSDLATGKLRLLCDPNVEVHAMMTC